ncbi:MAG TPA: DUF3574 domain-containing protein [Gemmatimonadales bacterium]|jgi:hypothetical protein|nr:DUF3574 domain-containing protein [Gemmatimonadales bacterium]
MLAAAACAPNPPPAEAPVLAGGPACPAGDRAMIRDVVYFGRNRPGGGEVGDQEWNRFLEEVVTPRFPNGYTVVAAAGHWRGRGGQVEREQTELLTLLHSGAEPDRQKVAEIAAEYKRRFRQEAVLRERLPACARFE